MKLCRPERPRNADRARLGRGEETGEKTAEDDQDQHQNRQKLDKDARALPRLDRRARRDDVRARQADDENAKRISNRGRDADRDSAHENLRHRGFGDDPVDDHQDGRWNERTDGPTRRDGPGGDGRVVARADHLGDRDTAHGRRGRDGTAGERRKTRAGEDRRYRQTTRQSGEEHLGRVEEPSSQAGVIGDEPHEQKHGNRAHRPGRNKAVRRVLEDPQRRTQADHRPDAAKADEDQGERHRHPQDEQQAKDADRIKADLNAHSRPRRSALHWC